MIGIKDMTSQEIKELASSRGKEIMEIIENSKGTEEGILQDWLRASAEKELELKVNAYINKLKEENPNLCDSIKDIRCSVIPNEPDSRTRIFEIKNEISAFLTGEEIKVLAFEFMKIPILAHIKAQSISPKSYLAIAKTLDKLYYCTEERSKEEIEQHFKNLRDTSYVWNPWIYNSQLFIDADELPVMYGAPTSKLSLRCKLDVTRSGYYVLDKIREISLFVGRIVNSMTTLYQC